MKDNVLISVRNLKKHYLGGKVRALDGINIDISRGEVVVVIGPSGSGKSTIINTNLSIDELRKMYTERITSRILGCFNPLLFTGKDIRMQKLQRNM